MLKRINNLRKIQARKQKMKEQSRLASANKDDTQNDEFNVKARSKT